VARGIAPAAAAWIWHDGAEVARAGTGRTRLDRPRPVTAGTVFDVASLTKVFASSLALRLVALGRASRSDTVAGRARLDEILSHRAGFEAWLPLFERVPPAQRGGQEARRIVIAGAEGSAPVSAPGARTLYSDLGYIALVPYLEERSQERLDRALATHVTSPLGLAATHYRPPASAGSAEDIAATEDSEKRGGVIQGQVHDDNAHAMGGISAHAGIFSTAAEVGELAAALLGSAEGSSDFLPPGLARDALVADRPGAHTLCLDSRSPEGSSAGARFGPRSVGHLGFTGCSVWIDPDARLIAVLLTNRVNPGRDNDSIRSFRPAFHDAIAEMILG